MQTSFLRKFFPKKESHTKIHPIFCALGILVGGLTVGHATNIGFGNLGGNNTTVPANLGSFVTSNGNGYVVTNGATPNIGLTWDANWDIHTSGNFANLENQFVGGGAWDNEGNIPRIGQLDFGNHTIGFTANPGYALVLNSFDFGHTAETAGTTVWDITLTDSLTTTTVWTQQVTFTNGQVYTISPGFTGAAGASYTLTFNRISSTYPSDGRHGIDNLSFNQIAVPEPSTIALMGVAGLGLFVFRRRAKR
jgi:hypothetical protein